jgi:hypothetical protein
MVIIWLEATWSDVTVSSSLYSSGGGSGRSRNHWASMVPNHVMQNAQRANAEE